MIAVIDGTGYRVMELLHILSAIVAFGPLFLYPALSRAGDTAAIAKTHLRITLPALVLVWVFGMGLAGMSGGPDGSGPAYKMSQLWLSLAIVDWVILVAVSWFLIKPALSSTAADAKSKLSMGVGITHLGMIVGLVLMLWKPGF